MMMMFANRAVRPAEWERLAAQLKLDSTIRPRGRPRKDRSNARK
jgi:hypothetical protein